jgi:superfamily I DNA/RNA helicase
MKKIKVLGPPGTGKTFTLLNYVKEYIASGTPINRIGYFAFTRKAAYNARDTFLKDKDYKDKFIKKDLEFFQTLHSLAFHTLGLSEDRVMQPEHYEEVGRTTGVRVKYTKYDDLESNGYLTCDSEYFQLINKSRVKNISVESEFNTNEYSRKIDYQTLRHIDINLQNYKQKNNLIDYTDMINKFIEESEKSPTFDVIFIDEAQDLSPIQWGMFGVLKTKTKDIYMAGDDDQAIFAWAGADVNRFINEPADDKFLDESQRVPQAIQKKANEWISRIPGNKRIKKKWAPRKDENGNTVIGHQESIYSLDNVNLSIGKWLILARTNSRIQKIGEELKAKNLYYETKKGKSYDTRLYKSILSWTRWNKGESITLMECKDIFDYLELEFKEELFQNKELIKIEEAGFQKGMVWFDIFTRADSREKLYIRTMLSNGEKLSISARIKLQTIHITKGEEENNVILAMDNTNKIRESVTNNEEKRYEEHRIFYVGATRAKQNLYLLRAKIERKGYPV